MIPNQIQLKIIEFLESFPTESIAIIGMGNLDRADDGAGIVLAQNLQPDFPEQVFSESEKHAESFVLRILNEVQWQAVLFLDAAYFEGEEAIQFYSEHQIYQFQSAYSTHRPPFQLLTQLLKDKGKQVAVLGMRPISTTFLGPMTSEMMTIIDYLKIFLKKKLKS